MFRALVGMLAAAALLAGCQNASLDTALDDPNPATARSGGADRIGTGPVVVGMLVSPGDRDRRDGAALAVKELGAERISLVVHEADAPAQLSAALQDLSARDAKLVIGRTAADAGAVAGLGGLQDVPVLALSASTTSGEQGFQAFAWDEIHSAVEAAAYSIGAGSKRLLPIVPPGTSPSDLQRLNAGIEAAGGEAMTAIEFTPAGRGAIEARADAIGRADAVLLLAGLDTPAVALSALRASGKLRDGAFILGTTNWPARLYSEPVVTGSLICMLDRSGLAPIADRFRAAYGRPLSTEAAYAYDAVALAAGIVRAGGADALNRSTLTAPTGFRGALGPFRFHDDGSIKRNCSIYRIENRELKLLDPAPASF